MSWIVGTTCWPRVPDITMKVFLSLICVRNCMHWPGSVKVLIVLIMCRSLLIVLRQLSSDSSILESNQIRTLFWSTECCESWIYSDCVVVVSPSEKKSIYVDLFHLHSMKISKLFPLKWLDKMPSDAFKISLYLIRGWMSKSDHLHYSLSAPIVVSQSIWLDLYN